MVSFTHELGYLMDITSVIASNVKAGRIKADLTQKELAERCGVTTHAITDIEAGRRKPSIDLLFQMAVALGINSADLLNTDEKPLPIKREPSKVLAMYASIPDRVVELASEIGVNHSAWKGIVGTLEFASDQEKSKRGEGIG